MTARVGLVGARGHVGTELLQLLAGHDGLTVAFASSRQKQGQALRDVDARLPDIAYSLVEPGDIAAHPCDAYVLALPNGLAAPFVRAIDAAQPGAVVLDLSADHRFDDGWAYGLPEHHRDALRGATRIANPGCYATALQLALSPLVPHLDGPAHGFGVSGYSGAGTTKSDKNDPERLRDNFIAYTLTGHVHEREVSRHLTHPVRFLPSVAGYFRGIHMVCAARLAAPTDTDTVTGWLRAAYDAEPFVDVTGAPPEVKDVRDTPRAAVGGVSVGQDGRDVAVVSCLDNLLKGAASQAVQNLNLALGLDETRGLQMALPGERLVAGH